MLLALCFLILTVYLSWRWPEWGVALAANAFMLNAMLGEDSGLPFILIGLVGPLLCFFTLLSHRFYHKKSFYTPLGIDGFLVLSLFFLMFLSALYAKSPYLSLETGIRYLVFCASYFYAIRFVVYGSGNSEKSIYNYCFATMTISLLVSIYALIKGDSSSEYLMRLTIGEASPIPLSILVAQGLLISFYLMITSQSNRRILYIVPIAIFVYAEVLTNTRSTMLGIVFGLIVILSTGFRHLGFRFYIKISIFLILCIPVVSGFIVANEQLFERAFLGFERILTGSFGESEGDRVSAWLYALHVFSDNYIWGIGTGNFGQYYIAYPHNIFLEVLSENGLIGFLVISLLLCLGFRKVIKRNSGVYLLVAALFVFSFVVAQVSLTLWMHKAMFIWLSILLMPDFGKSKAI